MAEQTKAQRLAAELRALAAFPAYPASPAYLQAADELQRLDAALATAVCEPESPQSERQTRLSSQSEVQTAALAKAQEPVPDSWPPMTTWTGCNECDCVFSCYNGQSSCIRLPKPAASQNPNWCPGCSPENCPGCVGFSPESPPAPAATLQEPVVGRPFDAKAIGYDAENTYSFWARDKDAEGQPAPAATVLTDAEIDAITLEATGFDGFGTQPMNYGDIRRIVRRAIEAAILKGQPAPAAPDYAWPTIEDYERDLELKITNDAFKIGWRMARTTNGLFK